MTKNISQLEKEIMEKEVTKILQEEIAGEVWYQDRACEEKLRRCLQNAESRLQILVSSSLAKVRRETLMEVRGEIIKSKSSCKVYHNSKIDTPDKIQAFNFTLDCIQELLTNKIKE